MGTRKRMGMFDHAKFSKPVLRSITDSMQRAVNRDIGRLLDPDTAAIRKHRNKFGQSQQQKRRYDDRPSQLALDVSVVNDSFEEQEEGEEGRDKHQTQRKRICPEKRSPEKPKNANKNAVAWDKPPIILASHYKPEPKKQLGLGRDPTFSAVRDALLKAAGGKAPEKSPDMSAEQRIAMLLKPARREESAQLANELGALDNIRERASCGINFLATTPSPPRKKGPAGQKDDDANNEKELFPKECPLDKIAARLMDSFPTITLRNNEPQTLTEATFSLAKHALVMAKNRQQQEAAGAVESGSAEGSSATVEMNPFKTLCDKTMHLFPSYLLKDTFHTSEFRKDHNNNRSKNDTSAIINRGVSQGEQLGKHKSVGYDSAEDDYGEEDEEQDLGHNRGFTLEESPTADLEDYLFESQMCSSNQQQPFTQDLDFGQLQQSQQSFSTQSILSSDFGTNASISVASSNHHFRQPMSRQSRFMNTQDILNDSAHRYSSTSQHFRPPSKRSHNMSTQDILTNAGFQQNAGPSTSAQVFDDFRFEPPGTSSTTQRRGNGKNWNNNNDNKNGSGGDPFAFLMSPVSSK